MTNKYTVCSVLLLVAMALAQPLPGHPGNPGPPPPGGMFGPPVSGNTLGYGPGGACRPTVTFRPPQPNSPPSSMPGSNQGAECLSFTIGTLDGSKILGSFNVYLLTSGSAVGADQFASYAVGATTPETASGPITTTSTKGFTNLTVSAVFPQFVTCSNATAETVATYAQSTGDCVKSKIESAQSGSADQVWQMVRTMKGGGILCEVQANTTNNAYYFIAKNIAQLGSPTPTYRQIGIIMPQDMIFLKQVQKMLCTDFETVGAPDSPCGSPPNIMTVRRKRDSTDTYGFTSCSKK